MEKIKFRRRISKTPIGANSGQRVNVVILKNHEQSINCTVKMILTKDIPVTELENE